MPYWHRELEPGLEVTAICAQTSWRSRAPLETSARAKKNLTPFGGTKFPLLLTGEGCKGVAAHPATEPHSARDVHRLIYAFSWAFTCTTSHDAANCYIRAPALTKFSTLESNQCWQGRLEVLASCPCSSKSCLGWLYKARGGRRRGSSSRNVAHINMNL